MITTDGYKHFKVRVEAIADAVIFKKLPLSLDFANPNYENKYWAT